MLIEINTSKEITQTLHYRAGERIDKLAFLKYGLDRHILDIIIIIKSYIWPIIQYGDVIMPSMNGQQVQNTESVHKWAGMIIFVAINGASSEIAFSELGWWCISKFKKRVLFHKYFAMRFRDTLMKLSPGLFHERTNNDNVLGVISVRRRFRTSKMQLVIHNFYPKMQQNSAFRQEPSLFVHQNSTCIISYKFHICLVSADTIHFLNLCMCLCVIESVKTTFI